MALRRSLFTLKYSILDVCRAAAYLEPRQTSKMELFAEIVNSLKSLTIFEKKFHVRCLMWFWLRLCSGSQCASWRPLKVFYIKKGSENWLFYKVARSSCGQISWKLSLSSFFLVKLQGTSLQVYQQMNPSVIFLWFWLREIQNTISLEQLPMAAIYRILQTHTNIQY